VFLTEAGQALYVGKASNLRARVRSYLRGGDERPFLRALDASAHDVEFVATVTEQEALLLENTLIKQRKPRFNVKLRDDKAFLLLRLDRSEEWPWYRLVRRRRDDGADYFGPFASAKAVRRTLQLLHKVTPLRDCSDHIFYNRSRPCIKHQIGRCPAPCTGLITREAYEELLERSVRILRGDAAPVLRELRAVMEDAVAELQFERAQVLKLQLEALSAVVEKQAVAGAATDADAIGLHRAGDQVSVAFLCFRQGLLESCRKFRFRSELPDDLLLADLLGRFYEGDRYVPAAVLLPSPAAEQQVVAGWLASKRGGAVELLQPQRGERRRQLELAMQNAALQDAVETDAAARARAGGMQLAELLQLGTVPERIHCLDVSTIQGTNTVASRVSFLGGKPDKTGYRSFRISTEHAGSDFSAMREAVRRSLLLSLEEREGELPDLMMVDGGKGQLSAALDAARELGLEQDLAFCGLAKSRLRGVGDARRESGERVFLPGRAESVPMPAHAAATLLLARVRDEAHRFAITYHRKRRQRLTSEVDAVPGVGPGRRRLLLRHFGSLRGLRAASRDDLRAVPGLPVSVADAVFEALGGTATLPP
jgi:excinuclease ABC subunit C